MDLARAESITARDFSTKVKTAVEVALKKSPGFTAKSDVSFFPDPGIVGFILQEAGIGDQRISDLSKLTTTIAAEMPGLNSKAAVIFGDRGPIVGFFPVAEIALRE